MNKNIFAIIRRIIESDCVRGHSAVVSGFAAVFFALSTVFGQADLPPAGPTKSAQIPAIREFTLKNGLRVAVVEKPGVPLVSAYLLVKSGSQAEAGNQAGLAKITATMLTKGTKSRSAEKIADEIEFLGASIDSGAGRLNSYVTLTVTSDKIGAALAVMSDVVLNPMFDTGELDLLKSQTLDELKFNLTQPGFLANYVASRAVFGEHPVGGTAESIAKITREDTERFYRTEYHPERSILIFVGDITLAKSRNLAEMNFGRWSGRNATGGENAASGSDIAPNNNFADSVLVVDMPDSGQASVNYFKRINGLRRGSGDYYVASVYNSILGGGYSSRLNQEIRIKRGLSYGAGSGFAWRPEAANFSARAQTKNESAAEVADLMLAEISRLASGSVSEMEIVPRKSVLIGSFGRSLETNASLAGLLADLYTFDIPAKALSDYIAKIDAVTPDEVCEFAASVPQGGTIIIVGDYAKFREKLSDLFPGKSIRVVSAAKVDVSSPDLSQ